MDPLNNMCTALVSINNILQKRKQKIEHNCLESITLEKTDDKRETITDSLNISKTNLRTSIVSSPTATPVMNGDKNNELHFESLTEDNFYRAHLYNRSIDELPNVSAVDINQFKLINICTIQDLLGRYLIHDTPKQFRSFLIKNFQFNGKIASFITDLLDQWTKYNIDGIIENEK